MTTQEETEALKACPFCAGSAYVVGDYGASYSVKCNNPICGAAVRLWGKREGAIAAWNRRSSSKAARGMREALEDIAEHPGPNADDAAWCRHDRAKEALAALTADPEK